MPTSKLREQSARRTRKPPEIVVPPANQADLEKEKIYLAEQRRELDRKIKQHEKGEVQLEMLVQRMEEAIDVVRPRYDATAFKPSGKKRTAQELVLLFSDTHAAEVVTLEGTRGINEYNWSIMLERMDKIRTAILSHKEHFGYEVSKLNVFMLGDMLSGQIHEELMVTNDRTLSEATVQFARDTISWLEELAKEFPAIHVAGVPGNHPRFAKKTQAKLIHNNADFIAYKVMEIFLEKHPQFTFDISTGGYSVQHIAGKWRALLMHGDGIRSTMPGVPWGGVIRRVTTLEAQFAQARQPLDFVFMGHFHTANSLDGIHARTFVNGSTKGVDEYGLQAFGSGRPAEQTLLSFHPKRGWTGQHQLNLQETKAASDGWT